VLLIIEDDVKFARIMVGMAREKGFKAVVATRGDTGLALANELQPPPSRWTSSSGGRRLSILDRLKRNPRTRHIPVHVISIVEKSKRGAAMGAFAYWRSRSARTRWKALQPHPELRGEEGQAAAAHRDDATRRRASASWWGR